MRIWAVAIGKMPYVKICYVTADSAATAITEALKVFSRKSAEEMTSYDGGAIREEYLAVEPYCDVDNA